MAAPQDYFNGAQPVSWRAAYDRRWPKAKFPSLRNRLGKAFIKEVKGWSAIDRQNPISDGVLLSVGLGDVGAYGSSFRGT
jgi:hypothetical protein